MDIWIEARHRYSEMVANAERARLTAEAGSTQIERTSVVKAGRRRAGLALIRLGNRLQGLQRPATFVPV